MSLESLVRQLNAEFTTAAWRSTRRQPLRLEQGRVIGLFRGLCLRSTFATIVDMSGGLLGHHTLGVREGRRRLDSQALQQLPRQGLRLFPQLRYGDRFPQAAFSRRTQGVEPARSDTGRNDQRPVRLHFQTQRQGIGPNSTGFQQIHYQGML